MSLEHWYAGLALQALLITAANPIASGDLASGDFDDSSLVGDARCTGWESPTPLYEQGLGRKIPYDEYFADEAHVLARAMVRRCVEKPVDEDPGVEAQPPVAAPAPPAVAEHAKIDATSYAEST
jgi:hypothetical protein